MDSQTRQTGRPIIDWFDESYVLRDARGDKIGEIVEINPDFIVAESDGGFLGLGEHKRYFVPRSHVTGQEGSDWFLSIDKDQLESMNWSNAPGGSTFANEDWKQLYGYGDDEEGGAPWYLGDVQTEAEGTRATGTEAAAGTGTGMRAEGGRRMRMVRFEEDLQAQTVQRQAGEVTIRKDIVEDVETVEVPVRREEVHVERRPVTDQTVAGGEYSGGEYAAGEQAFSGGSETITVPVMQEEVEVRKVARPVEEVVVSKDTTEETRRVSDTVRREQFDIEGDEGLTATPEHESVGQRGR